MDISVGDFGAFEAWLREKYGKENPEAYHAMSFFRGFMLCAQRLGMTSGGIANRLSYIADGPSYSENWGKRDAYSTHVANQVREGAWRDIQSAIQRITTDGPQLAASGEDPELRSCWSDANVAWAIANLGLSVLRGNMIFARREKDMSGELTQRDLLGMFHLNLTDSFVISTLLSLDTGLPIESVDELEADCLRNEARGYADLQYVKRRQGSITKKSKRIKVEGIRSPGALIKIVLNLTQTTRRLAPAEEAQWLLVGCVGRRDANGNSLRRLKPGNSFASEFCARHVIVDDKLEPINRIARVNMRKTFKAAQYKKANGHLSDAADDHTKSVHANHYANIPALANLHETAIADGLTQALTSAMSPIILTEADERRVTTNPSGLAADVGLSEDQIRAVDSGEGDVWFASCLSFSESPYAAPGEDCCPCPVWGCLSCKNAVVSSSKLPAVIAFLNHILQRRQEMDLRAWAARFAVAYHRITKDILPRFPDREILLAKAVAAAEGDLVWLPAELTMTR